MSRDVLRQAELFALLALFFVIGLVMLEKDRQDNPPILLLSEQDEAWRFALGSAELTPAFAGAIRSRILPLLETMARSCGCDTIEVIGHTDGVAVRGGLSELDHGLAAALLDGGIDDLQAGSNVDLGMMRALAVVALLREGHRAGRLAGVRFFAPYSAGQMLLPDGTLSLGAAAREDAQRRRIEIRLLRSASRAVAEAPG
jgi:hypothetical protein